MSMINRMVRVDYGNKTHFAGVLSFVKVIYPSTFEPPFKVAIVRFYDDVTEVEGGRMWKIKVYGTDEPDPVSCRPFTLRPY